MRLAGARSYNGLGGSAVENVLSTNIIDGKPMRTGMISYFVTCKSELFPFDQATMHSYQGDLIQNPGYQ